MARERATTFAEHKPLLPPECPAMNARVTR